MARKRPGRARMAKPPIMHAAPGFHATEPARVASRAVFLVGCLMSAVLPAAWPGAAAQPPRTIASVEWIAATGSTTAEQLARMHTDARVRVAYTDGTQEERALAYVELMSNLTRVGGNQHPTGALYDQDMQPIADPVRVSQGLVSENPDGSTLAEVGGELYHLAQFEYDWLLADGSAAARFPGWAVRHANGRLDSLAGNLPSAMVLTRLAQDAQSGVLTPLAQYPVDFSAIGGIAWTCNASQTPWGTFLSSEENYSVDARELELDRRADPSGHNDALAGFTRLYHKGAALALPYVRGVLPEVTILADATTRVVRHYAMGRGTAEMGLVMPDRRSVLIAHDGTNKPLTFFVADRPEDLSQGTLYAARFEQINGDAGGRFEVSWVRLGHATDTAIGALVARGVRFSDIFDVAAGPASGYSQVYVGSHKHAEYLKVKDAQAAAFLETLRYAAVKGASTELRKAEGLAYNRRERVVYLAISDVGKGMLAGRGSGMGGDQIRVRSRVHGGAVYALPVSGGQRDTHGAAIESAFVPAAMHVPAGLLGSGLTAPDALGNRADADKIANPDNLFYVDALRTLFIAEDSGLHTANVLWAYHVDTGKLTRLLSAVAGAELTGLRVHGNVGGHAYALLNAQHVGQFDPGASRTLREAMAQIRRRWQERRRAPLGYISGLPAYAE